MIAVIQNPAATHDVTAMLAAYIGKKMLSRISKKVLQVLSPSQP